jgi:hypothetical protein
LSDFIFMLTHEDRTVPGAIDVYRELRDCGLKYVGFKDIGADDEEMEELTVAAHQDGLEVMLEVVSTTVEEELRSVGSALRVGVDWLLGGTHSEQALQVIENAKLRYCPFPGVVTGHPSQLSGDIAEIVADARELTERENVAGVDLLAYRHTTADPLELIRAVVEVANGDVIVAGSIASFAQIRAVAETGAFGFTIGSAIFEGRLPGAPSIAAQVRGVVDFAAALGRSGTG